MNSNQPKPNTPYRILKLQSGEEIITKINGRKNGKVCLDKPMIIQSLNQSDMLGRTREVIFLKKWLSHTASTTTKIPENFIVAWHVPTSDLVCMYDMERNMMGIKENLKGVNPFTNDSMNKDAMNKILRDLDKLENKLNDNNHHGIDKFVFMNMALPPELAKELFEEGLFEEGLFEEGLFNNIHEELSKEINDHLYTGEEKNDPDYGNRWTDWNPNPLDDEYL